MLIHCWCTVCVGIEIDGEGMRLVEMPDRGWLKKTFGDLTKASVAKQITVGGVSGWSVQTPMLTIYHNDPPFSLETSSQPNWLPTSGKSILFVAEV